MEISETLKDIEVVLLENIVTTEKDQELINLLKTWDLEIVFPQLKGLYKGDNGRAVK